MNGVIAGVLLLFLIVLAVLTGLRPTRPSVHRARAFHRPGHGGQGGWTGGGISAFDAGGSCSPGAGHGAGHAGGHGDGGGHCGP